MQYRTIGATDLKVSTVGLGTWAIGGQGWGSIDDAHSLEAIEKAVASGITLIDTAPAYGGGHAEEIVGRAVSGKRNRLVISTKCGLLFDKGFKHCLTPASIRAECEASLKRLQTDYIDLYFCHWPDPSVPVEETVDALTDLQKQGSIRHFGLSNHGPDLLKRAIAAGPVACVQDQYSLVSRALEKSLLPLCAEKKIGVLSYGPLGGGILTGKYTEKPSFEKRDARNFFYPFYEEPSWTKTQILLAAMKTIAGQHAANIAQVAIAWVNQRRGISCSLVGAKTAAQVSDNAAAGDLILTDSEMTALEKASNALTEK